MASLSIDVVCLVVACVPIVFRMLKCSFQKAVAEDIRCFARNGKPGVDAKYTMSRPTQEKFAHALQHYFLPLRFQIIKST